MGYDAARRHGPIPQPTPIAVSDIPSRAAASADAARAAVASAAPDARLIQIQQALPDEQARIATLREETTERMKRPGPASMIKESEKSWERVRARLDRWMLDLSAGSSALEATLGDLQSRTSLWELTRDRGSETAYPVAVKQQIHEALKSLADAEKQARSARDSILDLQATIANEKRGVDDMLAKQREEIGKRTKGLVSIDSPPLWKSIGGGEDRGDARALVNELLQERVRELKIYLAEQGGLVLASLLMWPVLTLLMVAMGRKAKIWAQQDASLRTAVTLLGRPASSALIVTAILNVILRPKAPSVWVDVVGLVVALAVIRVFPQLLPTSVRSAPYLAALLIVLWRLVDIMPDGFFVHRLALLMLAWAVITLKGFLLFDPMLADVRRMLDWTVTVGNVSIAPGDILIFGFFIWLSFKIASFVQFVLDVQLTPRMDLPRGVPRAISRLTRYAVVTVGAVIASAAAGFDINKVTIIVGALGVGVGFGLQNIVNNFVSGLILLFERPIRVGDSVDIDDTGGVVEKIGMRATVVSTWDGAEVIVPNANLISEDVTNWTLTHDRRRMIIPVGVAYDADPEQAARLIVDVANENKDVDDKPEPVCLFMGFGDSAHEFELRVWAAGSDVLGVASDLRFAIVKKLRDADIEIPFPQRDLHLRTANSDAVLSAGLKEQVVPRSADGAVGPDAKNQDEKQKDVK